MSTRRIRSPAYGTVRSLLLFGLLVVLVDRATATLVETAAVVAPSVDPGLLTTAMAAVLWLALARVAIGEVGRQREARSDRLADRGAAVAYLDDRRPDRRAWALAGGAALGGTTVAVLTRGAAEATLAAVLAVGGELSRSGTLGLGPPATVVLAGVFLAAVLAAAWGVDRLVIGLVRELHYRYVIR